MSLIGKEIGDFRVEAYQNNNFKTVSKEDVLGKWSVFFFYPVDFTFICPTELADLVEQKTIKASFRATRNEAFIFFFA